MKNNSSKRPRTYMSSLAGILTAVTMTGVLFLAPLAAEAKQEFYIPPEQGDFSLDTDWNKDSMDGWTAKNGAAATPAAPVVVKELEGVEGFEPGFSLKMDYPGKDDEIRIARSNLNIPVVNPEGDNPRLVFEAKFWSSASNGPVGRIFDVKNFKDGLVYAQKNKFFIIDNKSSSTAALPVKKAGTDTDLAFSAKTWYAVRVVYQHVPDKSKPGEDTMEAYIKNLSNGELGYAKSTFPNSTEAGGAKAFNDDPLTFVRIRAQAWGAAQMYFDDVRVYREDPSALVNGNYLISSVPSQGMTHVTENKKMTLLFRTPMDESTLTPEHFSITGGTDNRIQTVTSNEDGTLVVLEYEKPLNYDSAIYTLTLKNTLKAADQTAFHEESITFTMNAQAVSKPKVIETEPVSGAEQVALQPVVSFTFDQSLNPDSVTPDNVVISPADAAVTSAHYDEGQKKVSITFDRPLQPDTEYAVALTDAVLGADGTPVDAVGAKTVFTTVRAPKLMSTSPLNGEKDVSPQTAVILNLDQPITAEQLKAEDVTLEPPDAQVSSVELSEDGAGLQLNFDRPLKLGVSYQVTIPDVLKNQQGISIGEPIVIQFTTLESDDVIIEEFDDMAVGKHGLYSVTEANGEMQLSIDRAKPENYCGDTARAYLGNRVGPTELVYFLPEGLRSFKTYLFDTGVTNVNKGYDISYSVSSDNISYDNIEPVKAKESIKPLESGFSLYYYEMPAIPAGMRYLKITLMSREGYDGVSSLFTPKMKSILLNHKPQGQGGLVIQDRCLNRGGEDIRALEAVPAGSYTPVFVLCNAGVTDASAALFCAAYRDNILVNVVSRTVTVRPGSQRITLKDLDLTGIEGCKIKLIAMESIDSLIPLPVVSG